MAKRRQGKNAVAENSATGIAELDGVLHGGFPKGTIVLLSGSSGSGKTIFSLQWLFHGVKEGENGVYISLTEPLFKIVKNLETMRFYDREAMENGRLKILDIRTIYGQEFYREKVIDFIEEQVKAANARRVCIDSVTAIAYNLKDKAEVRKFIFELGRILTALGCTTVLTSETADSRGRYSIYGVEEFISDAIIKLDQVKTGDELQRTLQIIKVRGRSYSAEEMKFRITSEGIRLFPKMGMQLTYTSTENRISTGNVVLDRMLGGGVFTASSTVVAGPTGTGKSLIALEFLKDGLEHGEPCLLVSFEESRDQVLRNAKSCGWQFAEYENSGLLEIMCVYPSERFVDEHLAEIRDAIERKGVRRCAVDSLSSISTAFSDEKFVSFTKRLHSYLKSRDITSFLTASTPPESRRGSIGEGHISATVDNFITLRQVELEGELRLVLNIVKERGSTHSKELRRYDITGDGIIIGPSLAGYEAVITGVGRKVSQTLEERLRTEFSSFMGPMGDQAFRELARTGISEDNVTDYIGSLVKERIMGEEDAKAFRASVLAILRGGTVPGQSQETKIRKGGVISSLLGK